MPSTRRSLSCTTAIFAVLCALAPGSSAMDSSPTVLRAEMPPAKVSSAALAKREKPVRVRRIAPGKPAAVGETKAQGSNNAQGGKGAKGSKGAQGKRAAPAKGAVGQGRPKPAAASAQGVRGVVVDPDGNPVPRTAVVLVEDAGADIFRKMMLAAKKAKAPERTVRGETDRRGRFEFALPFVDRARTYEVRVANKSFLQLRRSGVKVEVGSWSDLGEIRLARGVTVRGRITARKTGEPVPDAQVSLVRAAVEPSPLPGDQQKLVVRTDGNGWYLIPNAAPGTATLSVAAEGFARVTAHDQRIRGGAATEISLELPRGVVIGGVVTDAAGKPVPGARLETTALSRKEARVERARSRADGSFQVVGLADGPYQLKVAAPGFLDLVLKPIQGGDSKVRVVLEGKPAVSVRVLDKSGKPMRRFHLTVKMHFVGQNQLGNTTIPPRVVEADAEGRTRVPALEPGSYVFQIEAEGHAKAFSAPVDVGPGGAEPKVEVRLDEGGTLVGRVVGPDGKPVAKVRVRTLPDHLVDSPFTRVFKGLIPFKVTKTATVTDAEGRYRLPLLTPGKYQLEFTHDGFCTRHSKGHQVDRAGETVVPAVELETGTIASGVVERGGKGAPGIKVVVSSAPGAGGRRSVFHAEAITDARGRFTMTARLPRGTFQVMAARQDRVNPLEQVKDFNRTKKQFEVTRGQDKVDLKIEIDG